jgi:hypothetical protein
MRELLLGAGHDRQKRIWLQDDSKFKNLVTLDINPDAKPSVIFDLELTTLPFKANLFNEIHAYEVLEHVGKQGDWRFFLRSLMNLPACWCLMGQYLSLLPRPIALGFGAIRGIRGLWGWKFTRF